MQNNPRLNNKKSMLLCAAVVLLGLTGCPSIPPEASTLSHQTAKDLNTLHKGYKALANELFMQKKQAVNEFYTNVYAPKLMEMELASSSPYYCAVVMEMLGTSTWGKKVLNSEGITQKEWTEEILTQCSIDASDYVAPDSNYSYGDAIKGASDLFNTVTATVGQAVEEQRSEALAQLEKEKDILNKRIDDSFAVVISGQNALTAWVDSLVEYDKQREKVAQQVGLGDLDNELNALGSKTYDLVTKGNDSYSNIKEKLCKAISTNSDLCKE